MTRAASLLAAPSGKTLALLASLVLAIHAVLLVYTGPSFFRFEPNPLTVAALQTRLISAAAADPAAPAHEPRAISNAKPKAQTPRKAPVAARQGVSQGTLAQTPSDASEPSPPWRFPDPHQPSPQGGSCAGRAQPHYPHQHSHPQ